LQNLVAVWFRTWNIHRETAMTELVELTPEKPSFFDRAIELFSYPFRGGGFYIIPPNWQAVGDWGDMLRPIFLILGVTLLSFLPAIALWFALAHEHVSCSTLLPWGLLLAGCLYFPMALTATAMLDSPIGLNPLFVVRSIFRVGWVYFIAWGILILAMIVSYLLISFLPQIFCVTNAVVTAIFMYLLLIVGRVCGLLYRHCREKLDWLCE